MAIRFTIDHYEPRSARPELENDYNNLMYCCDTCNSLKGDRCPPQSARHDGFRFYRPDNQQQTNTNTGGNVVVVSVEGYSLKPLLPFLHKGNPILLTVTSGDRLEPSPLGGPPPV